MTIIATEFEMLGFWNCRFYSVGLLELQDMKCGAIMSTGLEMSDC
jgi:hypothetical protein